MKPPRLNIIKWLEECKKLNAGEALFLPCVSGEDQKELFKAVYEELKVLSEIAPEEAASLSLEKTSRFSKAKGKALFVSLTKKASSGEVAFKKTAEGETERVVIEKSKGRLSRLLKGEI